MNGLMKIAGAVLGMSAAAWAQDLGIKAAPQKGAVVVVNGTVHPVSGPVIPRGYVLFDGGKISAVGDMASLPAKAQGARSVDAAGKHVYPGMVSAYTQLGLTEIGAVRVTQDFNEVGTISPEVRACVAVNPDSTLFPVTRASGIVAAGVFPSGGSIPGRASVIRLDGWTWEQMTVEASAGLVVSWPLARPVNAWWMDRSDEDQLKDIRKGMAAIEDAFAQAKSYVASRDAKQSSAEDLRWEAMRPALAGKERVFIQANDYDQITSAVSFGVQNGLKVVIVGGRDAAMCAPLLVRHKVGVIVDGLFKMPKRDDAGYDEPFALPNELEKAGVTWCLASGEETPHERNLPFGAAWACAYGLNRDAAYRAVSLSPAMLLGVGDRLGSLEEGKEASFIITSAPAGGDPEASPLEMTTKIEAMYIEGREVSLTSKHTELEKKYRIKYRQSATEPAAAPTGSGGNGPSGK